MENINTLRGTLYAKDCRKVPNKKKPTEPDWEFYSIKIETKVLISGRTLTQVVELHLDKSVSYDGFEIGDPLEVDYYLSGKAISDTWFKTEAKAIYIKFAEIEGVVKKERPKPDTTFVAPSPTQADDDNLDNLPF